MQQHKQLVLAILLAAICGSAQAFDGARSGFMIGVGGGFHTTDLDVSRSDLVGSSGSEAGTQLRLTIGAGINEKFTVYGVYDVQADGDAVYGLLGPGGTFYFRDTGPTFYLFGGTGLGLLTFDDDVPSGPNVGDDFEPATGVGLLFGGGYAFTKGFHLDASLMYLDLNDDENFTSEIDYEISSLRVTASYTWF